MNSHLLVPIHLDGLLLSKDRAVVDSVCDFSRLPWTDGIDDRHNDFPWLSQEILSQPFQNRNLHLKSGMHLHWSLPDALTKSFSTNSSTNDGQIQSSVQFPSVPNRWLITRKHAGTVSKQWIVESDYLYPEGHGQNLGGINYPYPPNPSNGQYYPFRYLGRTLLLEQWDPNNPGVEYLPNLTAVGYGEPTFAALYSNCRSVFGLYDSEANNFQDADLQYDLLGWYSRPEQDPLQQIRNALTLSAKEQNAANLNEAMQQQFQWELLDTINLPEHTTGDDNSTQFPDGILCFARFNLPPNSTKTSESSSGPDANGFSVTVGNTGTESLSAHLASELEPTRKNQIEDKLEAVFHGSKFEDRELDSVAKFKEARHEHGFHASNGGIVWSIRLQSEVAKPADASVEHDRSQLKLDDRFAHHLNHLNSLQTDYDKAHREIQSQQERLYSDWYKYTICQYPPEFSREEYPNPDQAQLFLKDSTLRQLIDRREQTGFVSFDFSDTGVISNATTSSSSPNSIAVRLATAINALLGELKTHNLQDDVQSSGANWILKQTNAPRFWRPNEPVILLHGKHARSTDRHGEDGKNSANGLLRCGLATSQIHESIPAQYLEISQAIDTQIPHLPEGQRDWSDQHWHPIMLEWEVELFPIKSSANISSSTRTFGPDFIESNFKLEENEPDLSLRNRQGDYVRAANVYSGTSILTPYASENLQKQLESWFQINLVSLYYSQHENVKPSADYFYKNVDSIFYWYEQSGIADEMTADINLMIRVWRHLEKVDFNVLSQSLGGFNDALLMHRLVRQLPIANPLGFPDDETFKSTIVEALGRHVRAAPEPLNDFNPIRSGIMKIIRLRLIDTFGQSTDLDVSKITSVRDMEVAGHQNLLKLQPRLSQASRLNFRWLSATLANDAQMNEHPASNPICGWLIPNNLDNSLEIHDANGLALGAITANHALPWQSPPGAALPTKIEDIGNIHLRKLVSFIVEKGVSFLNDLITALDNANQRIEPENFAAHQDLALLTSRPLALVRASIGLELDGLPAIDHSWNAFRQDQFRTQRSYAGFTKVNFHVRLGEYGQLNDGLAAYLIEQNNNYALDTLFAPQTDSIANTNINTHADVAMSVPLTPDGLTQTLAFLIDPRGKIHATCGILPTKELHIPTHQYATALENINSTFLTSPVLTATNKIQLPYPDESGYSWSWLQKQNSTWSHVHEQGRITQGAIRASFGHQTTTLWKNLIENGWLIETDPDVATIVTREKRTNTSLDPGFSDITPEIENLLDQYHISRMDLHATFNNDQIIREGWLRLTPEKK